MGRQTFFGTDGYTYPFLAAAESEASGSPTASEKPRPVTTPRDRLANDCRLSRPELWTLLVQTVFSAVVVICAAALAGFQARWLGRPSGLSGFLLFVATLSLLVVGVMLLAPLGAQHVGVLVHPAARAREPRSGSIVRAVPAGFVLVAAVAQAVSTGSARYCPLHALSTSRLRPGRDRDAYLSALSGFCASKVAATIFLWFLLAAWGANGALFWAACQRRRQPPPHNPAEHPHRSKPARLSAASAVVPLTAERGQEKADDHYPMGHDAKMANSPGPSPHDYATDFRFDPRDLECCDLDDDEAQYAYFVGRYGSPALRNL